MRRTNWCLPLIASSLVLGCQRAETAVRLEAVTTDGSPLADLEIAALPFDPDRLLDSLGAAATAPAPSFRELESELLRYERPAGTKLAGLGEPWRATWDSVQSLADSLRGESPSSRGYPSRYARLRELYRRLAQRAAARDSEYRKHFGEDRELALRAAAAADSLRAWERVAYADFAALADSEVHRAGRPWRTGVTDPDGVLELELEQGNWWLVARMADTANPFAEHYWNVPIVVRSIGPLVVPLYELNKVTRWRH